MPEKIFTVEWPNGEEQEYYSPSSVIEQFLNTGESYTVQEFLQRATDGLNNASERVRESYGYACSRAQEQLHRIESKSKTFNDNKTAIVKIISIQ